jgi:hypothetical protein
MTHEERELANLAGSIAVRLRRVCQDLSKPDFAALCMRMACAQRRGEARSAAEWALPWQPKIRPL